MKHAKNKLLLPALVLAISLSLNVVALAASGTRTLEVTYRNIKLVIDGQEVTPKDAAGNVVEPFQNNGTTYLPVRAVAEALGKEVKWDGATNTVIIGNTAHLPYQVNYADLYDGSDPNASFSVAGKGYKTGVVLYSFHSSAYEYVEKSGSFNGSAVWNTEGHQTMTFTVGHVGDLQYNGTLYVALNGVAAGEYQLKWDGSPQTISVPLNGAANVKLTLVTEPNDVISASTTPEWNIDRGYAEAYGIYNVTLS